MFVFFTFYPLDIRHTLVRHPGDMQALWLPNYGTAEMLCCLSTRRHPTQRPNSNQTPLGLRSVADRVDSVYIYSGWSHTLVLIFWYVPESVLGFHDIHGEIFYFNTLPKAVLDRT